MQQYEIELASSDARTLLELKRRRAQVKKRRAFRESGYFHSPSRFAQDCINWPAGRGLIDYQGRAMDKLYQCHRLAVRGPRGASKTTIAALTLLWFAITREMAGVDWKIGTTAGSNRQLVHFLWPEVEKWAPRIRWDMVGRSPFTQLELLSKGLKLKHGHAFGAATKDKSLIEGLHADEVLMIFDESKAIADDIFDAFEGAFATGNAFVLALSTPGDPVGRFYNIFARKEGLLDWETMHITLAEAIAAGQTTQEWADKRLAQWGKDSRLYQAHVEGNFSTTSKDCLIPLHWIELANERWEEWKESGGELGPMDAVGSDVATGGRDSALIAPRHGRIIPEIEIASSDTMQLTGRLAALLRAHPGATAIVDVQTVGAGVGDRLNEQELNYIPFNGGKSTKFRDITGAFEFADTRSAGYWNLRDLLDPVNEFDMALPVFEPDRHLSLSGDLAAPRFWYMSGGKIKVESKNSGSEEEGGGLRKRLGRSTDAGDTVMQACWPGEPEEEPSPWFVAGAGESISGVG